MNDLNKCKTILFDLDGTLTDPGEGIIHSFQYALKKKGMCPGPMEKYREIIGPPLVDSFRKFCGVGHEEALEMVTLYREYFTAGGMFENIPYPGACDLMRELGEKGARVGIATSKPEPFTRAILERFGFLPYCDFIAGATLDEKRTRKDEVIAYAKETFGVREGDAMVGDRKYDILGGKSYGLFTVGVAYGYGSREELEEAGCDRLAEDIPSLRKILLEYLEKSV